MHCLARPAVVAITKNCIFYPGEPRRGLIKLSVEGETDRGGEIKGGKKYKGFFWENEIGQQQK